MNPKNWNWHWLLLIVGGLLTADNVVHAATWQDGLKAVVQSLMLVLVRLSQTGEVGRAIGEAIPGRKT